MRIAQRAIPTGLVYRQNEETLGQVGAGALQEMLKSRDWGGLGKHKVRRAWPSARHAQKHMASSTDTGSRWAGGATQGPYNSHEFTQNPNLNPSPLLGTGCPAERTMARTLALTPVLI